MFSKKESPPVTENEAAPASTKRSAMKSQAPSILSADLQITGSIMSDGEVQLDGSVDGDVHAGSLTIGEEASVKGEVTAESIVVRGRVEGSLRARQIQLASTARVEGDIVHASLAVESGAYFDGNCHRSSDPLSEKSGKITGSSASSGGKAQAGETRSAPSAPPAPGAAASGGATNSGGGEKAAAASGDPFAMKN
ncbi:polymer-forming cytoskeletal protein [Marinicauda salina]|jgi:cytoskeletal protein CcmA (bactofilin family)|uniref:Polymer-forming cytoskeletal protein n=2 Tax=Marinicauda salina TaxID=2135793 RepID=A0A2U2BTI1_9PROT|nr:polymer-forming cytoskeletal protein [Marinicauda salina]